MLALVAGILGLGAGGTLAVIGVWLAVVEPTYLDLGTRWLIGVWGAAGLIGSIGWLWLSACYLRRGWAGLRERSVWPWLALGIGALAAFAVVGWSLWLLLSEGPRALLLLLLGPPLLLPTLTLLQLRRRPRD